MKIVHISTSYKGGAGTAAFRIHKALLKNGVDSHFICLDQEFLGNSMSRPQAGEKEVKELSVLNILIDKIKWRLKHHLKINLISKEEEITKEYKKLFPTLKCEAASLPFSGYDILEDPFVKNADIIHLHWIKWFLDFPTFFKNVDKPVIWTLHDMYSFQGIFHYREDEIKNKVCASSLNGKVLKFKSKCIKNRKSKLSIVAPSKWILKAATQSRVFKNIPGFYIPYPLDMDLFKPDNNTSLKNSLNIPDEHTVFLFVAQKTDNYRKGFDLLLDALKKMDKRNITLMVIGNSDNLVTSDSQVILLGTIEDEEKMSNYYSIADAFILPSREDNLPNVMLESIACGTPVISFEVGGMAEIIKNGFNGLKAKHVECKELANVLNEFIKTKNNFSRSEIRNFALENFSEDLIAEKYNNVYKEIVEA